MVDSNNVIGRAMFWILVVIIFIYTMFPFYWAINSSPLTEKELQQQPATLIVQAPTSSNYVVVTVPLVILVLIFQKRIIEGMTAGAVKG